MNAVSVHDAVRGQAQLPLYLRQILTDAVHQRQHAQSHVLQATHLGFIVQVLGI
jgi:hypothetical protein